MQIGKILFSGLLGTTAMTLFSHLLSKTENKNLSEPQNLGRLINRLPINISQKTSKLAGWGSHYGIGMGFVTLYDQLWKRHTLEPSVRSGALLGAASGVIGVVAWKSMFDSHPNPQPKNLKVFLGQLVLAHVVFGVASAVAYKVCPDTFNFGKNKIPDIPVGDSDF